MDLRTLFCWHEGPLDYVDLRGMDGLLAGESEPTAVFAFATQIVHVLVVHADHVNCLEAVGLCGKDDL